MGRPRHPQSQEVMVARGVAMNKARRAEAAMARLRELQAERDVVEAFTGVRWSKIGNRTQWFAGFATNVSNHTYALTTSDRRKAVTFPTAEAARAALSLHGFQVRKATS